jgi:hypothetical protein
MPHVDFHAEVVKNFLVLVLRVGKADSDKLDLSIETSGHHCIRLGANQRYSVDNCKYSIGGTSPICDSLQARGELVETDCGQEQGVENFRHASGCIGLGADVLGAQRSVEHALAAVPEDERKGQVKRQDCKTGS